MMALFCRKTTRAFLVNHLIYSAVNNLIIITSQNLSYLMSSSTCSLRSMKADAPKVVADPTLSQLRMFNSPLAAYNLPLFKYLKNHGYSAAAVISIWNKKHPEMFSEALLRQLWLCSTLLWSWHYLVPENWPSHLCTVLHPALV